MLPRNIPIHSFRCDRKNCYSVVKILLVVARRAGMKVKSLDTESFLTLRAINVLDRCTHCGRYVEVRPMLEGRLV